MGVSLAVKGNSKYKELYLTNNYVGGIDLTDSDDTTPDNCFRTLLNWDLDSKGSLTRRWGFSKGTAFIEAMNGKQLPKIMSCYGYLNKTQSYIEDISNELDNDEIVYFSILEGSDIFQRLLSTTSIAEYQYLYSINGYTDVTKFIIFTTNYSTNKSKKWYYTVSITNNTINVTQDIAELPILFDWKTYRLLTNMEHINRYGKLYFTNNDKGLMIYDIASNTISYCFTDVDKSIASSAYKPTPLDVRKIGFNVIGDTPLTWIDSQGIQSQTIQGIYLTTDDNKPIQVIPHANKFNLNILYTGAASGFDITFKDTDREIQATKTLSTNTGGLAVYSIVINDATVNEIEISIKITGVTMQNYIDYYSIGTVSSDIKAVTPLNISDYHVTEMDSRAVYYKDNEIWFSELGRFDYVPNYNYVIMPLNNDDKISKICFFRDSYVILTENKLFKMSGAYGTDTFKISKLNEDIGCIAPYTVKVVNNELYFVSREGLFKLITNVYRENLENVKRVDKKIKDQLISPKKECCAILANDQYMLYNNRPTAVASVMGHLSTLNIPHCIRYYYDLNAFVVDGYGRYPKNIYDNNGILISFMTVTKNDVTDSTFYVYGKNSGKMEFYDFGQPNTCEIESSSINFGFPAHYKKVKSALFKMSSGLLTTPIYLYFAVNGSNMFTPDKVGIKINDNGQLEYDYSQEPQLSLPAMMSLLDYMQLDVTPLGQSNYYTLKADVPCTGKNFSFRLMIDTNDYVGLQSVSYVYKLGKAKE